MHYVTKCSGKYSDNAAAARYVHQMAHDIYNQLAAIESEIKERNLRADMLLNLSKENDKYIPIVVNGSEMSPSEISELITCQTSRMAKLENQLLSETEKRKMEIEESQRTLSRQLQLSVLSATLERDHYKKEFDSLTAEFNKTLNKINDDHKRELADLERKWKLEKDSLVRSHRVCHSKSFCPSSS